MGTNDDKIVKASHGRRLKDLFRCTKQSNAKGALPYKSIGTKDYA